MTPTRESECLVQFDLNYGPNSSNNQNAPGTVESESSSTMCTTNSTNRHYPLYTGGHHKRNKANARERNRMHSLNDALDRLRRCIPLSSMNHHNYPDEDDKSHQLNVYRYVPYPLVHWQQQQQRHNRQSTTDTEMWRKQQEQEQEQQIKTESISFLNGKNQPPWQSDQSIIETTVTKSSSVSPSSGVIAHQRLSKIETLRMARNYLILLTEILGQDRLFSSVTTGQILAYGLGQQSLNQLAILMNVDSTRQLCQPSIQVRMIFDKYCCGGNELEHFETNQIELENLEKLATSSSTLTGATINSSSTISSSNSCSNGSESFPSSSDHQNYQNQTQYQNLNNSSSGGGQ